MLEKSAYVHAVHQAVSVVLQCECEYDDSLFALGASSMQFMRIAQAITMSVGSDLRAVDLLDFPTVAELAEELHRRDLAAGR